VRRALMAVDAVAGIVLLGLLDDGGGHSVRAASQSLDAGTGVVFVSLALLAAFGAYDPASRLPGGRLRMAAQLVLLGFASSVLAALLSGSLGGTIDGASVLVTALLLSGTWIAARVVAGVDDRRHPARTLVVGTGVSACDVWRLTKRHGECAVEVVGFVDDDPLPLPPDAPATLGRLEDLAGIVHDQAIELVIVAYASASDVDLLPVVRSAGQGVRVQVVPRFFDLVRARGFELGRISMLDAGGVTPGWGERCMKRTFDIVAAGTLLVVLSPLLVATALTVRLSDGGPAIFRQRRVGRNQRPFDIYKFRTMTPGAERAGDAIVQGWPIGDAVPELKRQNSERHGTRVGRYLRPAGLDELPQLWNVLRGDMSLVGPRPLRDFEVRALCDRENAERHSIRPGMTGIWQVSGRDSTSWQERIELDCMYARHWSMTADLRILARTIGAVARAGNAV
jgi:exopolysaccharide biosynthesis polyprenyl glycosylphosphotransferase